MFTDYSSLENHNDKSFTGLESKLSEYCRHKNVDELLHSEEAISKEGQSKTEADFADPLVYITKQLWQSIGVKQLDSK